MNRPIPSTVLEKKSVLYELYSWNEKALNSPSEDSKLRTKLPNPRTYRPEHSIVGERELKGHIRRSTTPFVSNAYIGRIVPILHFTHKCCEPKDVTPSIYGRFVSFLPIISYSIKRNKILTTFEDATTQSNYNPIACSLLSEI